MSTGILYRSTRHCSHTQKILTNATDSIFFNRARCGAFLHYHHHHPRARETVGGQFINNTKCWSRNLSIGRKYFYSNGNDNSNDDDSEPRYKLPRRLLKRLQKQGITEDEFLSKLKATEKEHGTRQKEWNANQELSSTVREYLVNKLPLHSMSDIPEFPSDMPKYLKLENRRQRNRDEANIDPSVTSVVLFPGQGSQFVGMGKNLLHFPGVNELYEEASNILGYDLLKLCLKGPKSELDKTVYCQPSVMITSLAAVERLREEHPNAIENCVATAGFSVGEFAALVFAGVLNFPDAVSAVKIRAEAMQIASEKNASGMLTVFLAHDSKLKEAMAMAKEYCQERRGIHNPICMVANYLFPECKVIAGHAAALEFITTNYKEFGLLRTKRLPVSGAFHTQLMKFAIDPLENILQKIQINKPKIPVYSNLTGQMYHEKANFAHKLGQQLVKPVKWEQTMHAIYARSQGTSFPQTFELGPSKQMGTFLKQVNMQAFKSYYNIGV